jgi:hypothetical protein
MKKLNHNDLIIVNGRKGTVGTAAGYALQYNENATEAVERALAAGHDIFWANQEPAVLSGDPGYYEAQAKKWAQAVTLENGEVVSIEGIEARVRFMGDYSDFVHFAPV